MVSSTTKDVPPKRTFLIVLSLIGITAISYSSYKAFSPSDETEFVKDVTVIASDVAEVSEASVVEPLIESDDKPVITTYVVKNGDTLSSIASQFSISTNTLLWANDLTKKSVIKEGQKLTILPVSGVIYTVGKGDTLGGIALKFDVPVEEIISFNDLEDTKTIRLGMKMIIPDGELPLEKATTKIVEKPVVKEAVKQVTKVVPVPTTVAAASTDTKKEVNNSAPVSVVATDVDTGVKITVEDGSVSKEYFTHPIPGSLLTQGLHGYNSVDFGVAVGTKVYAAAAGTVIVAKPDGYNGGYGKHIVIEHDNGTQTLYAHLSNVKVSVNDQVTKGQQIALSGNSGRSTGPHLHFEVRGGVNPWVGLKKLTKF